MSDAKPDRNNYDIASISRTGQEKRANYVRDAFKMEKQQQPSGQFVKVFADIFLKHEVNKNRFV